MQLFSKKHNSRLFLFLLFIISSLVFSCYYDNEEDLYPTNVGGNGCDTTNVTYSQVVVPIMTTYCNSCHSTALQQGGVITDNYTDLLVTVNNSRLMGAIKHEQGYSPMPKGGSKISDCNILQIQAWINKGANND